MRRVQTVTDCLCGHRCGDCVYKIWHWKFISRYPNVYASNEQKVSSTWVSITNSELIDYNSISTIIEKNSQLPCELRGYSEKFRPNKDTKHIVKNVFIIFQRSLLITLHTSPSDAPISVIRPNSPRRYPLQNNCSRRWLPLHLTKICPPSTIFR